MCVRCFGGGKRFALSWVVVDESGVKIRLVEQIRHTLASGVVRKDGESNENHITLRDEAHRRRKSVAEINELRVLL